jgi:1-acyl-sn-glycerol-3-phosphate acyltransferase
VLVLTNHASILDTPALMAMDPYPDSTLLVKESVFRVPLVGQILAIWHAIPVQRSGNDVATVRALLKALREGRPVVLAPEGTRSRTGRLSTIHPVLARLAARAGVPVVPLGIVGSFSALPAGARFPRRRKILLRVGPPLRLDRSSPDEQLARQIRDSIAALLPPEQQPED